MTRLWRRVFHRSWWTLGWGSDSTRRHGLSWSLCLSNFNRPIVRWAWNDNEGRWVYLEWGNGSDPAIGIGYEWKRKDR